MNKAVDFLKSLKGNCVIIFHDDTDGVCSATLMNIFLKKKGIKTILICAEIKSEIFGLIENNTNFIFVDLAIDQFPERLSRLRGKNVLIVDHHQIHNDLNEIGFIHVNPRFKNPEKYTSASRVCYQIVKKAGLENFEWIANVGDAGDRAKEGTPEERDADDLISAIKSIEGQEKLISVVKFLSKCKSLDDFIFTNEFGDVVERLKTEIANQLNKFDMQEPEKIDFFEVRSKYGVTSILSNKIFDLYPDKTIVMIVRRKEVYKFSGRSNKYDLGKIFSDATKGIGEGGGHAKAAGASVEVKYLDEFKRRIRKMTK